jgi:hypothetical protein
MVGRHGECVSQGSQENQTNRKHTHTHRFIMSDDSGQHGCELES